MSAMAEVRNGPGEARAPDYFVLRVLAFLGLAIGVNLWLDHHEGLRFANSSAISMLVAAVTGALGLLERLLSKGEQEGMRARLLAVVRVVFWPPLLVVAWVVAVVLAATLSSVNVIAESESISFTAVLSDSGDTGNAAPRRDERKSNGGAVRFLVTTNPFGRHMRLAVDGYVPTAIDVYPLLGRRVLLGTDMRPS